MIRTPLRLVLAILFVPAAVAAAPAGPSASPGPSTVERLLAAALADSHAYVRLGGLCDRIGPRPIGSAGMASAVAWALGELDADGLVAVHPEPVMVSHWVRGTEEAWCTAPTVFRLTLLGLGRTVGTPPEGIEAPLLAVRDFTELAARAGEARGRIVLFDEPWTGYSNTVQYRHDGADRAARCGAVACLIRSLTGTSLATPHTGVVRYAVDRTDGTWADVPRIPAAALTVEDAGRLHRLARAGHDVRVRLKLQSRLLPDIASAIVIGEVRGRERPDEIVLIAAHLDSWDVGTGAHDDGAGCVIVMEAARLIARLPEPPRRTVRVALYPDEECGWRGGAGYARTHAEELPRHVAALECDAGAFPPVGFTVQGSEAAVARVRALARPLAAIGAADVKAGGSGADVDFVVNQGVPGIGHHTDAGPYMNYHHSPADTFDKIDARDLARNVAAVAALVYAIADDTQPLPRAATRP